MEGENESEQQWWEQSFLLHCTSTHKLSSWNSIHFLSWIQRNSTDVFITPCLRDIQKSEFHLNQIQKTITALVTINNVSRTHKWFCSFSLIQKHFKFWPIHFAVQWSSTLLETVHKKSVSSPRLRTAGCRTQDRWSRTEGWMREVPGADASLLGNRDDN